MVDLSQYDVQKLRAFQKQIEKEIAHRVIVDKKKALEEVRAFAKARGISLSELAAADRPAKKGAAETVGATTRKRRAAGIKYRHPDQRELTWTGRGRKPKWLVKWETEGKPLDALAV
jgi:DNA-binding protein H-NS